MARTGGRRSWSRGAIAVGAAGVLALGACTGDDGSDDGITAPGATDTEGDGDDADATDTDATGEDDATDEGASPEVPQAESVVTIEPLDTPQTSVEIRVGEIIVEFDGEVTDEGTVLTLEEPILFDFDSSTLKPESDEALDEIAEVVAFYGGAPVQVIGHTDDAGSADYNRGLSSDRAQEVFDGLVRRGIPEDWMSSEGRGFDDPAVPNDSDENRAINRRVEVLIEGVTPPDEDG